MFRCAASFIFSMIHIWRVCFPPFPWKLFVAAGILRVHLTKFIIYRLKRVMIPTHFSSGGKEHCGKFMIYFEVGNWLRPRWWCRHFKVTLALCTSFPIVYSAFRKCFDYVVLIFKSRYVFTANHVHVCLHRFTFQLSHLFSKYFVTKIWIFQL